MSGRVGLVGSEVCVRKIFGLPARGRASVARSAPAIPREAREEPTAHRSAQAYPQKPRTGGGRRSPHRSWRRPHRPPVVALPAPPVAPLAPTIVQYGGAELVTHDRNGKPLATPRMPTRREKCAATRGATHLNSAETHAALSGRAPTAEEAAAQAITEGLVLIPSDNKTGYKNVTLTGGKKPYTATYTLRRGQAAKAERAARRSRQRPLRRRRRRRSRVCSVCRAGRGARAGGQGGGEARAVRLLGEHGETQHVIPRARHEN